MRFTIRNAYFDMILNEGNRSTGEASISLPVNSTQLYVKNGPESIDGLPGEKGIAAAESNEFSDIVRSIQRILTFSLEISVKFYGKPGFTEFVTESQFDEQILRYFGNLRTYTEVRASFSIRTPASLLFDNSTLEALLEREVGLAILCDALATTRPIGRYREFWRVLESAFALKNKPLVDQLSKFPPVLELGFDKSEIKEMWIIRGRASHAESSSGLQEYATVSSEVENRLERLRFLTIQVLLTKATWGQRSLGVRRLAHIRSCVRKDGIPVIFNQTVRDD